MSGGTEEKINVANMSTSREITEALKKQRFVELCGLLDLKGILALNVFVHSSATIDKISDGSRREYYAAKRGNFIYFYLTSAPLGATSGFLGGGNNGQVTRAYKIKILPEGLDVHAESYALKIVNYEAEFAEKEVDIMANYFSVETQLLLYNDGAQCGFFMEYVPGDELSEFIENQNSFSSLELKHKTHLAAQLAAQLELMHRGNGHLHGDIKAGNIRIWVVKNNRGEIIHCQARILDFGLSRAFEDDAPDAEYLPSFNPEDIPIYFDPRIKETGKISFKNDIYSLSYVIESLFQNASLVAINLFIKKMQAKALVDRPDATETLVFFNSLHLLTQAEEEIDRVNKEIKKLNEELKELENEDCKNEKKEEIDNKGKELEYMGELKHKYLAKLILVQLNLWNIPFKITDGRHVFWQAYDFDAHPKLCKTIVQTYNSQDNKPQCSNAILGAVSQYKKDYFMDKSDEEKERQKAYQALDEKNLLTDGVIEYLFHFRERGVAVLALHYLGGLNQGTVNEVLKDDKDYKKVFKKVVKNFLSRSQFTSTEFSTARDHLNSFLNNEGCTGLLSPAQLRGLNKRKDTFEFKRRQNFKLFIERQTISPTANKPPVQPMKG